MARAKEAYYDLLKSVAPDLRFNMVEVGEKTSIESATFHDLVLNFPGSRLIGFEHDAFNCEKLNRSTQDAYQYHNTMLAGSEGEADYYEAINPRCSSLYEPDRELLAHYQNMEATELQCVTRVQTTTLDAFMAQTDTPPVDFIRLDNQGAELDVLQAGTETLKHTLMLASEVEFLPIYRNQPLFGDVAAFMTASGFMFHRFLGADGRVLKPVPLPRATQQLWGEALFLRNITDIDALAGEQLLKLSALAFVFDSPDVTHFALAAYDRQHSTELHQQFYEIMSRI